MSRNSPEWVYLAGRIVSLHGVDTLQPRACESVTFPGKRDFAAVIKHLGIGRSSGVPSGPHVITRVIYKWEAEEPVDGERATVKERRKLLETGKHKEQTHSSSLQQDHGPAATSIFTP